MPVATCLGASQGDCFGLPLAVEERARDELTHKTTPGMTEFEDLCCFYFSTLFLHLLPSPAFCPHVNHVSQHLTPHHDGQLSSARVSEYTGQPSLVLTAEKWGDKANLGIDGLPD